MYGYIATATGWTFSQIDQLTMWDVNDLMEYWQDYPPTHVLVAAYLLGGNKVRSSKRPRKNDTGDSDGDTSNFHELAQVVTSAGGALNKKLPEIYKRDKQKQEPSGSIPSQSGTLVKTH